MMTVLELINAIENSRGGYDDPVVFARPVVGKGTETYCVVDFKYDATGGSDGQGELYIILSREG